MQVTSRLRSFLEAGFRPLCPLLFILLPLSRTNSAFWISTRTAPGPISQVLPGCRVRHPQYSKKRFVRFSKHSFFCSQCSYIDTQKAEEEVEAKPYHHGMGQTQNLETEGGLYVNGAFKQAQFQSYLSLLSFCRYSTKSWI